MVLGWAAAFTGRRCRLVMEFCFLAGQPRQFLIGRFRQQFCHRSQQRRDVHWFFEQRAGTGAECREELVRARGGDDNGNQWVVRGQLRKRIPPIPDRHIQVEQHQINWQGVGKIKRLLAVFSGNNKVIFAHEHVVQGIAHGGIVIHQQDAFTGMRASEAFLRASMGDRRPWRGS